MFKRNVLNSPRLSELKKRRRRAFLNRTFLMLGITAVLLALAAYLSRIPGINIAEVDARGNSIVDTESIQSVAEREIAGKYFWLFPKRNILIYPKRTLKQALTSAHPRLFDIDMFVGNDRVLMVTVKEREPLYTWCGDKPAEREACYFLDKEGYIFDEAPYFSGDVYFKFYGAEGVIPLYPEGSHFAPENFEKMVGFKEAVARLDLEPTAMYLAENGDVETVLSGQHAPKIFWRADYDPLTLAENLEVALDTEPLKTRVVREYAKLEYLDLRFQNKVYSKFAE